MQEDDFVRGGIIVEQGELFDLRSTQKEVRKIKEELYKLDISSLMVSKTKTKYFMNETSQKFLLYFFRSKLTKVSQTTLTQLIRKITQI